VIHDCEKRITKSGKRSADSGQVKRVLLLATTTGYQIRAFGEAAEKLGVRLVFATDRCDRLEDPWWDHAIPVRFHDEEKSVASIVAGVNGAAIDGVLAVGDRPTIVAAHAAAALGVPGNPPEAACASRNKLASRMALKAAGLPVPWFLAVHAFDAASVLVDHVPFPCVVKPLALSGSRGVIRANAAHDVLLIESFIPGREYALEGVLEHGTLRTFAIFDKPDPLDGPFFEETIYVTPSALSGDRQSQVSATVARAAHALGLRHGPVHAEVRVNESGVYVLEVAARPIGGLCSRALRFTGDASLEEVLLRHAMGQDITGYVREPSASGVMMIPIPRRGVLKGVEGIDDARSVTGVDDVRITAKPDQLLVPLPEGSSYLGFIFAHAERASAVEAALREAHSRLHFRIDRALI
jgi:biotin carboxylase